MSSSFCNFKTFIKHRYLLDHSSFKSKPFTINPEEPKKEVKYKVKKEDPNSISNQVNERIEIP
jgi:hypothetical protein